MKKILIFCLLMIFIVTGCSTKKELVSLMDYGEYNKITQDNIKQIEIIKYTEGGSDSKVVENSSIASVYNNLKTRKVGKETDMTCTDNTTIYIFTLKDETKLSLEIECGLLVIGNNRYILE